MLDVEMLYAVSVQRSDAIGCYLSRLLSMYLYLAPHLDSHPKKGSPAHLGFGVLECSTGSTRAAFAVITCQL
jgi:hypothetical protein